MLLRCSWHKHAVTKSHLTRCWHRSVVSSSRAESSRRRCATTADIKIHCSFWHFVLDSAFRQFVHCHHLVYFHCRPSAGDTGLQHGRRAFSVAGPMFWNSLPRNLRDPSHTAAVIGRSLKTFFSQSTSASEAFATMRYINWCVTYLLTYLVSAEPGGQTACLSRFLSDASASHL